MNCTDDTSLEVRGGEGLNLTTQVDILSRCHFVFTSEDQSFRCCYDSNSKDCDAYNYTTGNETKCLQGEDYSVYVDSPGANTCTLVMREAQSGQYKSYNADQQLLQECHVIASSWEEVWIAIPSAICVILVLGILLAFLIRSNITVIRSWCNRKQQSRTHTPLPPTEA